MRIWPFWLIRNPWRYGGFEDLITLKALLKAKEESDRGDCFLTEFNTITYFVLRQKVNAQVQTFCKMMNVVAFHIK